MQLVEEANWLPQDHVLAPGKRPVRARDCSEK